MKVIKEILAMALVMSMAGVASASSIAAKAWYVDTDGAEDPALFYGGTASLSLSDNLWISGMYLMGSFNDLLGAGVDLDSADGELLLGYTAKILDIGIGGRYSRWSVVNAGDSISDLDIWGPMVYVGLGNSFGDSILGWYVGGSYMFKDLGDADDANIPTFEHYNVEGGLFLAIDALSATVGYRYKAWTDSAYDRDFSGVAASLGFGF
jgi:hypothetical protein